MKVQRHNAIREGLSVTPSWQIRMSCAAKLRRRGFAVTQATLSRDIHEMPPLQGPRRLFRFPTAMGTDMPLRASIRTTTRLQPLPK